MSTPWKMPSLMEVLSQGATAIVPIIIFTLIVWLLFKGVSCFWRTKTGQAVRSLRPQNGAYPDLCGGCTETSRSRNSNRVSKSSDGSGPGMGGTFLRWYQPRGYSPSAPPAELVPLDEVDRAWVVLSCVGTNPEDTALQHHRQSWFHLTVSGPKVHHGDTDQVQGQNLEGPSLTAQMAKAIVTRITDDQGTVPSLISITELVAPKCPQHSHSQSKRSEGYKTIVVPSRTKRGYICFRRCNGVHPASRAAAPTNRDNAEWNHPPGAPEPAESAHEAALRHADGQPQPRNARNN